VALARAYSRANRRRVEGGRALPSSRCCYVGAFDDCQKSIDGVCGAEWAAVVACLMNPATTYECKNNKPNTSACTGEALKFVACDENGGPDGLCYAGYGDCNPMTDSCPPDYACDFISSTTFGCRLAGDDPAQDGEPCSVEAPPYCAHGTTCHPDYPQCFQYCCEDEECGPGGFCLAWDYWSNISIPLKICAHP
jgi:hypothetical protein